MEEPADITADDTEHNLPDAGHKHNHVQAMTPFLQGSLNRQRQ